MIGQTVMGAVTHGDRRRRPDPARRIWACRVILMRPKLARLRGTNAESPQILDWAFYTISTQYTLLKMSAEAGGLDGTKTSK